MSTQWMLRGGAAMSLVLGLAAGPASAQGTEPDPCAGQEGQAREACLELQGGSGEPDEAPAPEKSGAAAPASSGAEATGEVEPAADALEAEAPVAPGLTEGAAEAPAEGNTGLPSETGTDEGAADASSEESAAPSAAPPASEDAGELAPDEADASAEGAGAVPPEQQGADVPAAADVPAEAPADADTAEGSVETRPSGGADLVQAPEGSESPAAEADAEAAAEPAEAEASGSPAVDPTAPQPQSPQPLTTTPEADATEPTQPAATEAEPADTAEPVASPDSGSEATQPEQAAPEIAEPEESQAADPEAPDQADTEAQAPEQEAPEQGNVEPEAAEPESEQPAAVQPEDGEAAPLTAPAAEEAADGAPAPNELLDERELEEAQDRSVQEAVQQALAAEEAKSEAQRQEDRDERMRILGSAAAALVGGAILPELGARLIGQQGDRLILQQDDQLIVRHDESERLALGGGEPQIEEFADGYTRVTVERPDGTQVMTWRDGTGEILRRVRVLPDGTEITLFDGTEVEDQTIEVTELPPLQRQDQRAFSLSEASPEEIERILTMAPAAEVENRYSLRQVRQNDNLRWQMPSLALDAVTFETNSAELAVDQIGALDTMGRALREMISQNPREVFLVEGHTDAVGPDIHNLALSDRRAETVARLLTRHYDVPPENLITQGYGEQELKVPTLAPSRENRRVELRRITPLLR